MTQQKTDVQQWHKEYTKLCVCLNAFIVTLCSWPCVLNDMLMTNKDWGVLSTDVETEARHTACPTSPGKILGCAEHELWLCVVAYVHAHQQCPVHQHIIKPAVSSQAGDKAQPGRDNNKQYSQRKRAPVLLRNVDKG